VHRVLPSQSAGHPAKAQQRRAEHAALAATTGVDGPADVVKYLLAGADVVMTASALLRRGPEYAAVLLDGLSEWMARKGFSSVAELRGMHWGVIQLSVANLVVIAAMVVVFVAALLLPFPKGRRP